MLKRGKQFVTTTMAKAHEVQIRYNTLGAPWTQNVRNPLPMPQLILAVLPVLPASHSVIPVRKTTRLTALGKSFTSHVDGKMFAIDVLGNDYYKANALTVDEVCEALRKQGFIAHRGTVAMALNWGRHGGKVESMRFTKPRTAEEIGLGTRRNTSYCRYFVAA
jgi:hypothetical protein